MLYLYESHLGGLYWSENEYAHEDLYCEECGDSDSFLGSASNYEEATELVTKSEDHFIIEHIMELAEEAYDYFKKEEVE